MVSKDPINSRGIPQSDAAPVNTVGQVGYGPKSANEAVFATKPDAPKADVQAAEDAPAAKSKAPAQSARRRPDVQPAAAVMPHKVEPPPARAPEARTSAPAQDPAARKPAAPQAQQRHLTQESRDSSNPKGHREGYSEAYDQTYGAGAFKINTQGGDSHNMDAEGHTTSGTTANVYGDTPGTFESSTKDPGVAQMEAWFGISELQDGGDGNAYTYDNWQYNAHDFNSYDDRYYYSLSDPTTIDYLNQVRYDLDSGYIDDGLACINPNSGRGQAITNALEARDNPLDWQNDSAVVARLQSDILIDDEGNVLDTKTNTLWAPDSVEAQKVTAAKLALDADPASAAPLAFKSKEELQAQAAPWEAKPEDDKLGLKTYGQGADLAVASDAILASVAAKPAASMDSIMTAKKDAAPAADDPAAPESVVKLKAPQPAGPAPQPFSLG